ncbi:ubiquinone/menaquinone biosynthesis C-methylase UbiE [Nocardioides sp. HB32]
MSMGEVSGASVSLGAAFRPETIGDAAVAQMIAVLDAQDAAPSIERLRAWMLAAGDVRRGEVCVDVGSGTGTMTRRLAALAGPDGRALGVEPNGMLRVVAEARAGEVDSAAEFCQGLATEIPLPDESVDVLWCERVLQHVPEPAAAIAEFGRVLRPGGRALLLDSDHESRVESDVDPAVSRAMTTAFMGQLANPSAARNIPRQAIQAGLSVDPDVGSSALVQSQDMLLRSDLSRMSAEQAIGDGTITPEQAAAALTAQAEAARNGWAFWAVTVFGFVCRKD